MTKRLCQYLAALLLVCATTRAAESIRVAQFDIDATPPIGSPLAYDTMTGAAGTLTCRGIVLLGKDLPIVLCAVDWIGIANESHDAWREALAEAAGTVPERVAVHTLHQHDAPVADFSANDLLAPHGLSGTMFDPVFARGTIARAAKALQDSLASAQPVTHIGLGRAPVENIASNRRIMGPDGKVKIVRWTATADPAIRAEPAGLIDPDLRMISLWNAGKPIVALTYYATHPQSYYRTGIASPDFPGMARTLREQTIQVPHIHFNGAGGNIGAGKWNDGAPENRAALAQRLADGMKRAWHNQAKQPVTAHDLDWAIESVALPVRDTLDEANLEVVLNDPSADTGARQSAALNLAWLRRHQTGGAIDLVCLKIGSARVVHLPGEPVVEYQLAAQEAAPDLFVATVGYGDYGPGYICLEEHYSQGGYEDSPGASRVAPRVELALLPAIQRLVQTKSDGLASALVFFAPFDHGADASLGMGDRKLFWAPDAKGSPEAMAGLPPSGVVTLEPNEGLRGGALKFHRKAPEIVFFRAGGNISYQREHWSGSVSFWLKVDPREQLETGFCDPIQITSRAWNDAAFFVEFEKRDNPKVPFRLGAYSDFAVWNPDNRPWSEVTNKPLLEVTDPPFASDRWTHVVFTFENFNTGQPDGVARLYLDGKPRGALGPRKQVFTWDIDQTRIMLGLNYIGLFDELAIFNRALTENEIRGLYNLEGGPANLTP